MKRILFLLLICGAAFAQIQDIPGTEAVGVSRQKIVDNFNFLNAGKAVATIGTALPATCAYNAAGPVVLFVNSTGPTLSVCTAPNVWTQVLGGGSVTWGQVLGTLSNQADLSAALAGKAAALHAANHQNGGSDEVATASAAASAIPKAGPGGKLDIGWLPTGQTGTTVALGNDARFTDARAPTAHAGSHLSNGSDAIAAATTTVRGTVTTTTSNSQAVSTDDTRMTNARTPTAHAATHQYGGGDEVATATAAANAIPKAGLGAKLDIGWIPTGSTASTVAAGNDSRLSDARTPTAHAGTHSSNGSDAIAAATTTVRGTVTTTTANSQAVSTDDARMTNARAPTSHASTHQNGGSDEVATATAAANAIPKADASGKLGTGWIPDLSATYTKVADKTGTGSKIASAASVPADGCANWSAGNLGSTGLACGSGGGGISDVVQDLTPQLGGDLDMNGHNIQTVTPAEMAYVHGVTSALQPQLDGKVGTSDSRLSDARTPTAHAGTHLSNGSDAIAAATTTVRGTVTTTTANSQAVSTDDARMTNARTPTSHAATHQNGGGDEVATATAAANAIPKAGVGAKLDIGWIPTGSTASTVAVGNDSRLSDARTPTSHAGTHLSNGSDAIAAATTTVRGTVTTTTANSQAVSTDDSRMANARTPTSHAATHQNGGGDEVATATAAANAIPKAGTGGKLDIGWIPTGSTASTVAVGNDSRLSDARTPTSHAATHLSNGSDAIAAATTTVRGTVTTTTASSQVASTDDSRLSDARTPVAPTATTLGGTKSFDCTGTGHLLKLDTTGTPTCSADSGAGGGIVNQTTGAGAPSGNCTAPSTSNLTVYTDTTNQDEWFCSATNTWKKLLSTNNTGTYIEVGAEGTAPAVPLAGQVKCYFDSTAHTQICLDSSGNAFIGIKGSAARTANQFMTHVTPAGIPQTAALAMADLPAGVNVRALSFTFGDPGGSALTAASTTTVYYTVPFACTIAAWNAIVDAGTITFDVWKVATGTAIPTATNTIVATANPAISTGTAARSTTLTGWTTGVAANDIIAANVKTVATAKYANLVLQCNQ